MNLHIIELFDRTKAASHHMEDRIVAKHIMGRRLTDLRIFVNKNFTKYTSYGFVLGILLIIASFIDF